MRRACLSEQGGVPVGALEPKERSLDMLLMLLALLVILIVAGAGFALHVLWWVAIAALIVWLIGFFARRG